MKASFRRLLWSIVCLTPSMIWSAEPTAEQALSLTPIQPNVEYDTPTGDEIQACKIEPITDGTINAWVVYDGNGQLLRRFVDTNGDNKVDQWCYAKDGIEVYRDIDADYNGKADQYRWFATAGLRWGLDNDEDGKIDQWKWISPEEVSREVVEALANRDLNRFQALLLTNEEASSIGIGKNRARELSQKTKNAVSEFSKALKEAELSKSTRWVDFSAPQPGVVPSNGDDIAKDLIVYENAIALTETDGKHGEVNVGTLVKVGEAWKLIGAPRESEGSGYFFTASRTSGVAGTASNAEVSPEMQQLIDQLEAVDAKLARANSANEITLLTKDRADVLRRLAQVAKGKDQELWLSQLIDSVSTAAQSGNYPNGVAELKRIHQSVSSSRNRNLIAQAQYALMTAEYSASLQAPDADYGKIQKAWEANLERFVSQFPKAPQAADAMLQLAIAEEFNGNLQKANSWYSRIVRDFPESDLAVKAKGARTRITSVGKPIRIAGKSLNGKPFNLSSLRGNIVLIHYWATWCEPCKKDMERLRSLEAKYRRQGLRIVGINLDNNASVAASYARKNRIGWEQLHEPGGLDSPLATNMGIFTVPVMILVDAQGKVMNNGITLTELESVLTKKLARRK